MTLCVIDGGHSTTCDPILFTTQQRTEAWIRGAIRGVRERWPIRKPLPTAADVRGVLAAHDAAHDAAKGEK